MTNHPIQPPKMSSSPFLNVASPEPTNDSNDTSSPKMYSCENQLAHWDWNRVPHKNLPELCIVLQGPVRRTAKRPKTEPDRTGMDRTIGPGP